MKKEDLVYICSPLSAPKRSDMKHNMIQAGVYARMVSAYWECRAIAPHSFLPDYLDDTIQQEREAALEFGLSVLKLCKALVICGNVISNGMQGEIRRARELGIPIYRMVETGISGFILVEEREEINEM